MAAHGAVDAEGDIAIGLEGVAIGVHAEEDAPEEEAAVAGHEGEDGVEDDAGAVAHGCEGPAAGNLGQLSLFFLQKGREGCRELGEFGWRLTEWKRDRGCRW